MIATTTWKHNLTNYENIENINDSGFQHLEIFQPLATNKVRLQLNNLYDEIPLEISKIEIHSNSSDKKIVTLDNSSKFHIEPRLIEWSDWTDIDLPSNSNLSIDIYSTNKTIHTVGLTISNGIIKTAETDSTTPKYFFGISAIQVEAKSTHKKIAFFGDSLTNQGNYSAPLALDLETNFHIMTANFGISGNRLLRPGHSTSQWSASFGEAGFTRFDHMLTNYQPNLVVFMEGLNDLLHPGTGTPMSELPSAEAVVKAIYILKAKCRKHDAKFVPMTITPFGNSDGWTPEKEALRLEINAELLKMPHILDVSALVSQGNQLKPDLDCGDHVHFSAAGGKIIADYVKEQLIRKRMI